MYNYFLKHRDKYPKKAKFYVINYDDPRRSHRCNPIHPAFMTDIADACESAYTIMPNLSKTWNQKQGDFFAESSIILLTSIIWHLKLYEDGKYCTFPHAIDFLNRHCEDIFPILSSLENPSADSSLYRIAHVGAFPVYKKEKNKPIRDKWYRHAPDCEVMRVLLFVRWVAYWLFINVIIYYKLTTYNEFTVPGTENMKTVTLDMYDEWFENIIRLDKHTIYQKSTILIRFFKYLVSIVHDCYIPPTPRWFGNDYIPHIYTHEEISRLYVIRYGSRRMYLPPALWQSRQLFASYIAQGYV